MAVGKGSIGRVSKAVEKQIPAVAVESVEVVEEVVEGLVAQAEELAKETPVKEVPAKKTTTRKPATKKPTTKKTTAKKTTAVKSKDVLVSSKSNIQLGDKMPVHLM